MTDFILYILTKENKPNNQKIETTQCKDNKNNDKSFLGKKTYREDKKENNNIENKNEEKNKNKNMMNIDKEKKEDKKSEVSNIIKNNFDEKNIIIDYSEDIILDQEHKSIIDLFNYSAQRKCVELKDNSPITKKLLYEYLPKKTIISCLTSLLFSLSGNSIKESFVTNELSSFCKNSKKKIYFLDMDNSFYSYTLYNGNIIINKQFFDLMNSQKEKIQIGSCNFLLSIFHEMAFLLTIKLINNLNMFNYYKYRKDIIEQTGEKLEELLLGRKRKSVNIKGKEIVYTNFSQLPMKNVRYINNFKVYNNDYNRYRKNFELMYNDFHMNSGDKPDNYYFKYKKNDLNYERIDLKNGILKNIKNFDLYDKINKNK